jgi:glutamate N-acetyltransferase/amino-acid N-acetyltransferase
MRKDLALIVAPEGAVAAGMFTRNIFCAAPVKVSRNHLERVHGEHGSVHAIVINSANANAATGEPGMEAAVGTARNVAELLGCQPHEVLVASTGVIGVPLPREPFEKGLPLAVEQLGACLEDDVEAGDACAHAIMTTDTVEKVSAVRFELAQETGPATTCTIGAMAKGSGMIEPNMATMLAVIATDAPLSTEAAKEALRAAVNVSFNKVTVDSDTSTNDSVFLLATGAAGGEPLTPEHPSFSAFVEALTEVCVDLARQIARDGEGATRLVTVNVTGAASGADADLAARAVANSPLVKTAVAGRDANWGRIAMALGKSGAAFEQEDVRIVTMGMLVCDHGLPVPFDEDEALRLFEKEEIIIDVDLGAGDGTATIWTCDLTHGYISINGDYRT